MKSVLKSFCLVALLFFFQKNLFSQNTSQVVKLTVTSQGSSQEEAKNNALRNAIQQTIGVFISANSTILNDNLIKDEIVSISNGTIQKYQILKEGQLSNNIYFVTLDADVSVTKLNSFIENKGVKSSFNGSLFSFNLKQKELSTINEAKAFLDLTSITDQLLKNSFEYDLKVGDPKNKNGKFLVPIEFKTNLNSNFITFYQLVLKTIESLSLTPEEQKSYISLGFPIYGINIYKKMYYFRNINTLDAIIFDILFQIPKLSLDFTLINKVENISLFNESQYLYYVPSPSKLFNKNDIHIAGKVWEVKRKHYTQSTTSTDRYFRMLDELDDSKTKHNIRVEEFRSFSNFKLISYQQNRSEYSTYGQDIYEILKDLNNGLNSNVFEMYDVPNSSIFFVPVSETIEKGILSKFLISQGLQQSEGKEESRYLKLFFSNYEIDFLKKINSLDSKEKINNFKINFSGSKFLLEFTNDELSKLDGFEIKKN